MFEHFIFPCAIITYLTNITNMKIARDLVLYNIRPPPALSSSCRAASPMGFFQFIIPHVDFATVFENNNFF